MIATPLAATLIGAGGGLLVVASIVTLDKLKIDDPVGAISVHLSCGIWGTLAVGIFSEEASLGVQALGVAAYAVYTVVCAAALFGIIKVTMGLRVSMEEEIEGLDYGEHEMHAYDMGGASTSSVLGAPARSPAAVASLEPAE